MTTSELIKRLKEILEMEDTNPWGMGEAIDALIKNIKECVNIGPYN